MKIIVYFFIVTFAEYSCAGQSFLDSIMPNHIAKPPFLVGENSYLHTSLDGLNQSKMNRLLRQFSEVRKIDKFNITSDLWKNTYKAKYHSVSSAEISCLGEIKCVLFNAGSTWLITLKEDNSIIDAALVYAVETNFDKNDKTVRMVEMDTTIGLGGFFTRGKGWEINFKETGIFCSDILFLSKTPGYMELYKRRVTREGKIESKEIVSWEECKAPW
jgi:hypothetical protein